MNLRIKFILAAGLLVLAGQGCIPDSWKKPESLQGKAIKQVTCETIDETRTAIHQEFSQQMEAISDAYWEEYRVFESDLHSCLSQVWKGGPCDDQWNALQQSYSAVSQDVSNDTLYNDYKAKKADWDACHNNYDEEYKQYEDRERGKEQRCQEDFQSKIDTAQAARQEEEHTAEAKRDTDLAALDEFEKRCKKSAAEGGTGIVGSGSVVVVGTEEADAIIPTPGPIQAGNDACRGGGTTTGTAIPGENSTPRTGHVAENPAKDTLTEILVQTAEDVTGDPIPTGAIDDKIFAGIVCTKLYGRVLEIQQAASDAEWSNDRREQIRLRKELDRYRRARNVWCAIAAGKPPTNLKAAVVELEDQRVCETDADCGPPVCCSNSEIGTWSCTEDGQCVTGKQQCDQNEVCSGRPAQCVEQPEKIQVIPYQGTYIPIDQLHRFTGPECDHDEHWHANTGSATAVDGKVFIDQSDCGLGKTKDLPVQEIIITK